MIDESLVVPTEPKRKLVYLAGPIGSGPKMHHNILNAIDWAERLMNAGVYPFVPHLGFYWSVMYQNHSYDDWMAYDRAWIDKCDAMFRMPGDSPGADREVEYAREINIPIFRHIELLIQWLNNHTERR